MKTVLIHHNNTAYFSESFFEKHYLFETSSMKDVDSYITEEFIDEGLIFDLNQADLVFIKVSLSNNYLEYLGIRLAYHLRLDSRVINMRFAIVFLGEESLFFLCKTCEYYPILLTDGVYKIRDNKEEIHSFIEKGIDKQFNKTADFTKFLDKIWLNPPSNFESNHSIANEWGICRLFGAIKPDLDNEDYNKLKDDVDKLTFKNSLYFKYTEAKIEHRQEFKLKNQKLISDLGILNLKVALIDDEHSKGWYSLYQFILRKSNVKSVPFLGFSKEISQQDLIDRIQSWIKDEAIAKYGCNTFLLDLRLHDSDFDKSSNEEELTGNIIFKFIKSLNLGYQIVFITASNKIWNIDSLNINDYRHYVVKESPDYKFGRNSTLDFFTKFEKALKRCNESVFLIEAHNTRERILLKRSTKKYLSDNNFLDLVFNKGGLLDKIYICLERGISNPFDLNQALLYCFHFLERYCSCAEVARISKNSLDVFDYNGQEIEVIHSTGSLIKIYRGNFDFQTNQDPHVIKIDKLTTKASGSLSVEVNSGTKYSSVLYFRENCSESEIAKVLELLFVRNNLSAHYTGNLDSGYRLRTEDIMFMLRIFDKIQF